MKDLNFIPKEYLEKRSKKNHFSQILSILFVFIIVMLIASVIPFAINVSLRSQKELLEKQVKETSVYAQKEKQIDVIRNLYKQREETSNKLSDYGVNVLKIYKFFEETLPENVFLNSLKIKSSEGETVLLDVSGIAKTEEDIASFINILRTKDNIVNISLPGLSNLSTVKGQEKSSNGCEFSISITINAGKW